MMTTSIKLLKTMQPPLRWIPKSKEFTSAFLEGKSKDSDGPSIEELTKGPDSVLQEAQRILGRCLPPTDPDGRETGLVVGYVQSGKTMSFETVIALSRDSAMTVSKDIVFPLCTYPTTSPVSRPSGSVGGK